MCILFKRALLFLIFIYICSGEDYPRVTIKEGTLKGRIVESFDGSKYYSFKGIPYAEPPLGELRFRDPLPAKSWSNELDAAVHGPICMQMDIINDRSIKGSENCLFLNVYTKSLDSESKYPVMFFIHGGSFMAGSGNSQLYGAEFLLQHGVVVVTINYRLEVLGFLSLNTPEVPGNAGTKDQVAALRWVKNNIAKFGGNPDDVTIFGESAGSASVSFHLVSPMSKGLFHKVIAQSGTSIADWANGKSDLARAFRVGKVLGKETKSKDELLKHLRSVSAEDLAGVTYKTICCDEEKYKEYNIFFNPIVEHRFENVESFLYEETIHNLIAGETNKVPLMIGYNSGEGLLQTQSEKLIAVKNNDTKYLPPKQITHNISEKKSKEIGDRIKKFYVGDQNFSNDTIQDFGNFCTDKNFFYNTNRFAYYYAATGLPVYTYRFNYDTDLNQVKKKLKRKSLVGASHGDELFYLFYNEHNKDILKNQEHLKEIIFNITKLWTNFAKSGNPTPDDSIGVTWEPLDFGKLDMTMRLEEPMSFGLNPDMDRLRFWNDLYCEVEEPCIKF